MNLLNFSFAFITLQQNKTYIANNTLSCRLFVNVLKEMNRVTISQETALIEWFDFSCGHIQTSHNVYNQEGILLLYIKNKF